MISKMKKLSALILKSDTERLLGELMWLSCVEVSEPDPGEAVLPYGDGEREELVKNLASLHNALESLAPYAGKKKLMFASNVTELETGEFDPDSEKVQNAVALAEHVNELTATMGNILSGMNTESDQAKKLILWKNYDLPMSYDGTKNVGVLAGVLPPQTDISALEKRLYNAAEGEAETRTVYESENSKGVCVMYHRDYREAVETVLGSAGFAKNTFVSDKTARELLRDITNKIKTYNETYDKHVSELSSLGDRVTELKEAYDIINVAITKEQTKERLTGTECTDILTGWVPAKQMPKVEKTLSKYVCAYEFSDPTETDDVPIELVNNKLADPFESLISFYSYPQYGSFDPTFIVGIFYSIFFGMMSADVGYGLLTVIGTLLMIKLTRPKRSTKKFLLMFCYTGVSSIIMGVLFNGWFGDLPKQLAENIFGVENFKGFWYLIDPISDPMSFFVIALAIGALHLLTGMGIKMYMLIKRGEVFSAIFDIGSWYVVFAGIGLYFVIGQAGLYIALTGVAMIVLTRGREKKGIFGKLFSGILGLYDIVSYMSDLLSYSRVLALSLSTAVIASVFNTLATLGGKSFISIILFPLAFLIGHVLNLALGLLGSFIHAGRLQYVEFFGKFYEDGGRCFAPLAPETKYTEIKAQSQIK